MSALLGQIPLSSRNAAGELRKHVLDYIRSSRLEPGSRLATEAELVGLLKVSRSTVRRALDPLEKDGWIDRRAGAGTFVGMRARLGTDDAAESGMNERSAQIRVRRDRGIVRVAVLIYKIGDLAHDWYTPGILEGLAHSGADDAAHVIVELLGDRDGGVDEMSRRLERSRPDALVVLSNQPNHAFVIRDAQRLGIPCFVSGTPHRELNLPSVCEDNRQAVGLVIDHLHAMGHSRIGLILPRLAEPWVFERFEAFMESCRARGVAAAVHWSSAVAAPVDAGTEAEFEAFLQQHRLTAVVPAHLSAMMVLDSLVRQRRLRVPDDVSVVSFEQDHAERGYLGIADASRVRFPLNQMGQTLASMARAAVAGEAAEKSSILPATLVEGRSVRACDTRL